MRRRYTSAIGLTGEPVPPAQLQRQAGERELAHAVARELLEVERLDDVDALADEQDQVPGQRAELGIDRARHVPRHVVGADRQRLALGAPARRRSRRSRRRRGTPRGPPTARPVPVRTRITSPGAISSPSAARSRSSAPTAWPASAQSSSTPRANSGGIVSVPSCGEALGRLHLRVRPRRPPCMQRFSAWWQNASMCVPECSAITSRAEALVRASPSPGSWRRCSFSSMPGSCAGHTGAPA